ncbi:hypothetical protein KI387_019531, partial [Taxus chinensis]
MNAIGLSLVLFSLVTAGVWSPEAEPERASQARIKPEELKYEREGFADAANKATQDALRTAAGSAKITGESIRHAASQARDKVKETGDKVEQAGEQVIHVIRSGADKTKDAVKSTASKTASVLHRPGTEKEIPVDETVPEHVESKPGKMFESAKEIVSEAVESVKDAAAAAKERMKDSQAEQSLKDSTQRLTDEATERREKKKSSERTKKLPGLEGQGRRCIRFRQEQSYRHRGENERNCGE